MDDDDGIRKPLALFLSVCGYEVESAEDGSDALELFQQQPFDLVILDLIMPEKEGLETLMDLRRIQPRLKIIAMSGGGRIEAGDYLELAERLGAVATMEKPFWQVDMLHIVVNALKPATPPEKGGKGLSAATSGFSPSQAIGPAPDRTPVSIGS
ncbi:MAG TPA: response regulator [Candidatus Limnocylindria bacterium]|nr:response regulator [Candidatus Limnocylindria bacterium]